MTQTRQVYQVKFTQAEIVVMFRAKALEVLASDPTTEQGDIEDLTNTNVNWRGTIDGGISILLDPVWPEA